MKAIFLILSATIIFSNVQSQIFHENMEIPDSVVSSSNGSGAWLLNSRLHTSSMYSDSASVQNIGDSIYLTTIPFSTMGYDSIFLHFNQICKIEFYDSGTLEVSTDNGLNWTQLRFDQGVPGNNCVYHGYSFFPFQGSRFQEASYATWLPGATSDPDNSWWKHEIFDISSIISNSPNAQIRFVLIDVDNNGGSLRSGWFLDDIFIDSSFINVSLSMNEELTAIEKLKVFPNPVDDEIAIQFYSNQSNVISIGLFNTFGQLVKNIFLSDLSIGEHQQKLDVSDLSNGIYFIKLENGSSSSTSKFVKIRDSEIAK